MFDGSRVFAGLPGTLYAAPIGTTEPTSVSGAWPAGWLELGFTDNGSEFDYQLATAAVEVEEELDVIRTVTTGRTTKLMFAMAELTLQNFLLAVNAGIGSSQVAASHGINGDGSLWAEPPPLGSEVRVMLGWDALEEGATAATSSATPLMRIVARQCFQTGTIKEMHRKGNQKSLFAAEFTLEKPPGVAPFRRHFPANLAA